MLLCLNYGAFVKAGGGFYLYFFVYIHIPCPCVLLQLPQELSLVFPMQWALLNILNRKCLFFPHPIHTFMKRPKAFSDQGREEKKKGFWSWALLNIDKILFGVRLEKLHADMFICTFLATEHSSQLEHEENIHFFSGCLLSFYSCLPSVHKHHFLPRQSLGIDLAPR